MAYLPQLLAIAGVMFLACVSPGPDLLAVTSHALAARRSGLGVAVGIAISHAIWAALAVFGLGLVVAELAWLYEAIRLAGAAYLLYLGAKMLMGLRQPASAAPLSRAPARDFPDSLRKGLLVGLTNPKGAAFFGSLFVTILPAHAPGWVHGTTVATVATVSISWFCAVAVLFSHGRVQQVYARIRRPVDAVMGSILIALGAKLALDR
jgi:threonine/homoserine/homoserine lactone efflux protein